MSSNDINKNMGNFFFSLYAVIFAVFIEITSSTVYFGLRQCDYIKAIRFIYVALPFFFLLFALSLSSRVFFCN